MSLKKPSEDGWHTPRLPSPEKAIHKDYTKIGSIMIMINLELVLSKMLHLHLYQI